MLAGATNRTHHFPTVTGATHNIAAWSVGPGQPGHGDAPKPLELPLGAVRSSRRKLALRLTIPYFPP